jgi:hypothetical protein
MNLVEIAKELELHASLNGVELLIDVQTAEYCFIPVIAASGKVGAIGNYNVKGKSTIGFFILNEHIVKYALDEGFAVNSIFDSFKKNIFIETTKDDFFRIMTEK